MSFVGQMKWSHSKATTIRPSFIWSVYVQMEKKCLHFIIIVATWNVDLLYNAKHTVDFLFLICTEFRVLIWSISISFVYCLVLYPSVQALIMRVPVCLYTAIVQRNFFGSIQCASALYSQTPRSSYVYCVGFFSSISKAYTINTYSVSHSVPWFHCYGALCRTEST